MQINPTNYRRIAIAALVALVGIVLTGAAVRLTGSGLGCDDWPTCYQGQFRPEREFHALVEFINRLITGAVSIFVVAAVLGSLRRQPRRRDLVWLAWGLVGGVVLQILLGAVTTLTDLHPLVVGSHFLASALLVFNATVLVQRSGWPDDASRSVADLRDEPGNSRSAWRGPSALVCALAAVVLVAGVVATAAGPHGGDEHVRRLGVAITTAVRVHSLTMWAFLVVLLVLARRARTGPVAMRKGLERIFVCVVAQGTIGYAQYFSGVPVGLVELHIAGSMAVWIATVWWWSEVRQPVAAVAARGDFAATDAGTTTPD